MIGPRPLRSTVFGQLLLAVAAAGCAGSLDPAQFGSSGSGTGGTPGAATDCTGGNSGDNVITNQCASGCHNPVDDAFVGGGLDLTIDSAIATRLVNVLSTGATGSSQCGGTQEPYLVGGKSPATGLLIQKIQTNPSCSPAENPPCCGAPMPDAPNPPLSADEIQCVIQWATTLTAPAQ